MDYADGGLYSSILNKHGMNGCEVVDGCLVPSDSYSKSSLLIFGKI